MVEIIQQAAELLHLAPGWEKQILFAAGDGDYSYFAVEDEKTIFRIGISISEINNSLFLKLNAIYALSNAFSVPLDLDDTQSQIHFLYVCLMYLTLNSFWKIV